MLKKLEIEKLQTGDILHVQRFNPTGIGIALGTSPLKFLSFRFVPTHTAIVVKQNGGVYVFESDYANGVHAEPIESWIKKNKRVRYTPVDATGYRFFIGNAARAMEGLDYEIVMEMLGIPFGLNDRDKSRVFCTEYVYRVYLMATEGDWASSKIKNPDNISPASFAFKVLKDWPMRSE